VKGADVADRIREGWRAEQNSAQRGVLSGRSDGLRYMQTTVGKGKGNPEHAQVASTAPRISRQSAHEGGKVVSPTHRPSLPPGRIPGTYFC
jgi:hypothetical protein